LTSLPVIPATTESAEIWPLPAAERSGGALGVAFFRRGFDPGLLTFILAINLKI
jgi:hypothetical protein